MSHEIMASLAYKVHKNCSATGDSQLWPSLCKSETHSKTVLVKGLQLCMMSHPYSKLDGA